MGRTRSIDLHGSVAHSVEGVGTAVRAGARPIEPGKLADIAAVAADPVAHISELERVIFVMKGGVVVKGP